MMNENANNLRPLLDRVDWNGYVILWSLIEKKWVRWTALDGRLEYQAGRAVAEDPNGSQPPTELVAKSVWPHG